MVLSELRKSPHLSSSAIGEYVECSLLYRFGRIDKLPFEFRSDNLEFGTVIHRVLGEFYQARLTGDRMPLNDIHKIFEERWRAVAESNDEIRYSNGKNFQLLLVEGIDLLTAWYLSHSLSYLGQQAKRSIFLDEITGTADHTGSK